MRRPSVGGRLSAGQLLDMLNWGSLSGTFSSVQLPTPGGALIWNTSHPYTTGVLSVIGGLLGDYNQNGVVDAADYTVCATRSAKSAQAWPLMAI